MVRVYRGPLLPLRKAILLLVDEVAPCSVKAITFFRESVALFRLVRSIYLHVNPEVLRPMSKLAFPAIKAETFFHKVPAERTFDLG